MDRNQTDSDFAVYFDLGVQEIERCLGLSPGAAQAKLRELCANGLVRSWWLWMGGLKQIKPSEWKTEEVDLATVFRGDVVVSMPDLDQQIRNGRLESRRDAEITRQLRMGVRPGKTIEWKDFCEGVRKARNARPSDRGFSNETIENVTRDFLKNFGQPVDDRR